jgi:hypothetical protein
MESLRNDDGLYDSLHKFAMKCAELKDYERARKIMSVMVKTWPERVVARGELASNTDVSDSELNTPITVP